jgi:orotate phosphoribosyltransferase
MKNVNELIEGAGSLAERGASNGEIADELNVSRDTASWLVRKSEVDAARGHGSRATTDDGFQPQDIHVDWSPVGRSTVRLTHVGRTMADLLAETDGNADLTVGVEKAGAPLATVVSQDLDTDLASYAPAKHQWDAGDIDELDGSFSRNFSEVDGSDCYVVDDTITSGTTMLETIRAVRAAGGTPAACVVLVDKQGVDELDGVPVYSLVNVVRVGDD